MSRQCNVASCSICAELLGDWASKTDSCQVICLRCFENYKVLAEENLRLLRKTDRLSDKVDELKDKVKVYEYGLTR